MAGFRIVKKNPDLNFHSVSVAIDHIGRYVLWFM